MPWVLIMSSAVQTCLRHTILQVNITVGARQEYSLSLIRETAVSDDDMVDTEQHTARSVAQSCKTAAKCPCASFGPSFLFHKYRHQPYLLAL